MLKRTIDVVVSAIGLVVCAPVIAIILIVIFAEDGGCPIFSQERIGKGGRPFTLYKFRSMRMDAESEGQPVLCSHDDKRLTRVGRFLREHHLDEMPQLWNILRGDMSLVGPRPERAFYIRQIVAVDPRYERLYAIRPGVFSFATLYNGYTYNMDKMLARLNMDLDYLEHHTCLLDMKLIVKTVMAVISGKKF